MKPARTLKKAAANHTIATPEALPRLSRVKVDGRLKTMVYKRLTAIWD